MDRLVDSEGQIRWGLYEEPVDLLNYADYHLRTPMGRRVGRIRKHFRVHQFTFFGFMGPDLVGGLAVVDLRYMSGAFAYVFDRRSGQLCQASVRSISGAEINPTPEQARSQFRSRKLRIAISSTTVSAASRDFSVNLQLGPPTAQPIRMCTRCGYRGWQYTKKTLPIPLTGEVRIGGRVTAIGTPDYRGLMDWTGGYLRHETCWNWAACATTLPDGRSLGFNLSCEVNETSFTENALWVDDRMTKLDTAEFVFDENDLASEWLIRTADGRIDLRFRPITRHAEQVNAVMVATRFSQVVGEFSGRVITADDEPIAIAACPGFVEDHYAKW